MTHRLLVLSTLVGVALVGVALTGAGRPPSRSVGRNHTIHATGHQ
jgi:hypothetical protein